MSELELVELGQVSEDTKGQPNLPYTDGSLDPVNRFKAIP